MNSENKNESEINDITNSTKKEFVENGCENIGKKWTKRCPKCNRLQYYKSIRSHYNAIRGNNQCRFCKNSGKGNPFFGKHHTDEHKNNLSKIQLNNCSYRYKKQGKNPDKIKKNCCWCDTEFYVVESKSKRKYCSYTCAINDNFGFDPLKKTKPEKKFEELLKIHNIDYKSPFPLKGKLYDFYMPLKNLLIEIDGIYWHGKGLSDKELNETQTHNRKNDKIKTCIAKEMGYTLVRIWEDEISEEFCTRIFT
jgi:very-short-patch-repair endonuclease